MAGTASASVHGHGNLSIPKIKKKTFTDSIQSVSMNNRDVQNLLEDVSKNCLDVNFFKEMEILEVFMVHCSNLEAQYVQKRAEMKQSGRSAQTLVDQLGFRMTNNSEKHTIAKEGLCAHGKSGKLGRGDCGIYLTRYFDVEVKCGWVKGYSTLDIFIFKYFTGKCKSMKLANSNSSIEPTPNYDSHIGNMLPKPGGCPFAQLDKSLIYLYEYTDECLAAKHPRHCLPYAIIKVSRKKKACAGSLRTVNVPRVTSSATAAAATTAAVVTTTAAIAATPAEVAATPAAVIATPAAVAATPAAVIATPAVAAAATTDFAAAATTDVAAATESLLCDKPTSPSKESSKVNCNLAVPSTQKLASPLMRRKILFSPKQTPSEINANGSVSILKKHGSVNTVTTPGETQDIRSKENQIAVIVGVQRKQEHKPCEASGNKLSQREKKRLPGEEARKASLKELKNTPLQIESKEEYMKRFTAATEKVEAEKNSKMLECLMFIPPAETEASASLNSPSTQYGTKSPSVGLPRAENQNSKFAAFKVPDSPNSLTRNDRLGGSKHTISRQYSTSGGNDSMVTTSSDARNPLFAEKPTFQRNQSTNEGGYRNYDSNSSVRNQNADPRLLKRSQSSGFSTSTSIPSSSVPPSHRVESRRVPFKPALKNAARQNIVKRKMSISEYKQRNKLQSNPLLAASAINDAPMHEKSTAHLSPVLAHMRTSDTKDNSSQNSNSVIRQSPKVHQPRSHTAVIEKLLSSGTQNSDSVSAAPVCNITSQFASKAMLPSPQRNQVLDCPAADGQTTKTATLQTPGRTSNIFNTFVDTNFLLVDPSLDVFPKPETTSSNSDIFEELSEVDKVLGSKMSSKTNISVKNSSIINVQIEQLSTSVLLSNKDSKPRHVKKGQLSTPVKDSQAVKDSPVPKGHLGMSLKSSPAEHVTSVKDPSVRDSITGNNTKKHLSTSVKDSPNGKDSPAGKDSQTKIYRKGQLSTAVKHSPVVKDLSTRNIKKRQLSISVKGSLEGTVQKGQLSSSVKDSQVNDSPTESVRKGKLSTPVRDSQIVKDTSVKVSSAGNNQTKQISTSIYDSPMGSVRKGHLSSSVKDLQVTVSSVKDSQVNNSPRGSVKGQFSISVKDFQIVKDPPVKVSSAGNDKKKQFSTSVKDSLVKRSLAGNVQKGQLKSHYVMGNSRTKPKPTTNVQPKTIIHSEDGAHVETSVSLKSAACSDSDADLKKQKAENKQADKQGPQCEPLDESRADLQASSLNHTRTKPHTLVTSGVRETNSLVASDMEDTGILVTSDMEDTGILVTSDMEDTGILVTSDTEETNKLVTSNMEDTGILVTSDTEETNKLVASDVEDTNIAVTSCFEPIHSATTSMNQHIIMTPIPWRHDQALTSDSEDNHCSENDCQSTGDDFYCPEDDSDCSDYELKCSEDDCQTSGDDYPSSGVGCQSSRDVYQSSEDDSDSCTEGSKSEQEQLSQDDFTKGCREQYGDKPLPKSVSMRDVGIECYLLALGDDDYQPLAVVVDFMQAHRSKDCKFCEAPHQNVPEDFLRPLECISETEEFLRSVECISETEEFLRPVECISETEEQANVAAASLGDTSDEENLSSASSMQAAEDSRRLPGSVKYVSLRVNQPNIRLSHCSKPNISAAQDLFKTELSSSSEAAAGSTDSPEVSCDEKCVGPVKCLPETEKLISTIAALPVTSLKMQPHMESSHMVSSLETLTRKDCIPVPGRNNVSSVSVSQSNKPELDTHGQPAVVAATDLFRTELTITSCLAGPSAKSCSETLPKRIFCAASSRETNTLTPQSTSTSPVVLGKTSVYRNAFLVPVLSLASVLSKDVPETSQKSPKKISLVGAYSDTESSNSDEDRYPVNKGSQAKPSQNKLNVISNNLSNAWLNIKRNRSMNKNNKNVEHAPKLLSPQDRELTDSKSEEAFREHLLEETYLKGSFNRKITEQNVLKDTSNRITRPHAVNKKYSISLKDSSSVKESGSLEDSFSDEETLRDKLLAESYNAKRPLERKRVICQQVLKDANVKTETLSTSQRREHQDVINSGKCTAVDLRTEGMARSGAPGGCKQRAEGDQSASGWNHSGVSQTLKDKNNHSAVEQNHSALSHTLREDRNHQPSGQHNNSASSHTSTTGRDYLSDVSVSSAAPDKIKPDKCAGISSHLTFSDKMPKCVSTNDRTNLNSDKDRCATISSHQTLADKTLNYSPAPKRSNVIPGKGSHAKISPHQTLPDEAYVLTTENSNVCLENDICAKICPQLADKASKYLTATEGTNLKPGTERHAQISCQNTSLAKTTHYIPTTVSTNLDCKQHVPEKSGTQKVQSVMKENGSLDLQFAHQFSVLEKATSSTAALITRMTKVEQVDIKAKNSADTNCLQIQKSNAALSDSLAEISAEGSGNSAVKRYEHIRPDNSSSRVKFFLDKVRESVEVKKHIDEEVLAFKKLIEETNGNTESATHKQAASYSVNKEQLSNSSHVSCTKDCNKPAGSSENVLLRAVDTNSKTHLVSLVENKASVHQNTEVSISETDQDSQMSVGDIATAFMNLQEPSGRSAALPTAAESWKVWKNAQKPPKIIEKDIINNPDSALGSSKMDNLMVRNDKGNLPLSQFDVDYRCQPGFSIPAVCQPNLSSPYGDEDLRPFAGQNIPAVQPNFASPDQDCFSTNHSAQGPFQLGPGIQDSNSHVQHYHPYPPYQSFPGPTWVGPQNVSTTVIRDGGNTSLVDEDYRFVRPEGPMPVSTNAALVDNYRPLVTGVTYAAAVAPLPAPDRHYSLIPEQYAAAVAPLPAPGRHCSLIPEQYDTLSYQEAAVTQNQNGNTSRNHDSLFWLSSKPSSLDNISGLGFDTCSTQVSGIPGLGDITHNHNGDEQSRHQEFKATAASSHATLSFADVEANKLSSVAKTCWPEIFSSSSKDLSVFREEKYRRFLNIISPKKKVVETSKIIEEDYSDEDQSDSTLPASQFKEHGIVSEMGEHSASVQQNDEVIEVPSSPVPPVDKDDEEIRKLLLVHLNNVISKLSSAPKVETRNDPLPGLILLRNTLLKTSKHVIDEVSEDTEFSRLESAQHGTNIPCEDGRSSSGELDHDNRIDNHKALGDILSPTKDMQYKKGLLKSSINSSRLENHDEETGDVCLRADLEQLETETASTSSLNYADSANNRSQHIKRSLSNSDSEDYTNIILSVSEKSSDPALVRYSSSPEVKPPVLKEADVHVEKRCSISEWQYEKSPDEDYMPPELNSLTRFTDKNVYHPTVELSKSRDPRNSSEFHPHCKENTDTITDSIMAVKDKLSGQEMVAVSDSLPFETAELEAPAPTHPTISVHSDGKVYLSDVPLIALSYAREKILSEINNLEDPDVASLPKTPTSELTAVDGDDETASTALPTQDNDASPSREIEEGEINSSDSEIEEIAPVNKDEHEGENREAETIGCIRKRKPSLGDEDDFENDRRKMVKHDVQNSGRKEKYSKTDIGSKNNMNTADAHHKLSADVIYITDSDTDSPSKIKKKDSPAKNKKTEKTVFDRLNLKDLYAASKHSFIIKEGVTSMAYQGERIFMNTPKKKNGHDIYLETKKAEKKVKSAVEKKEEDISDISDLESVSDWETDCGNEISASVSDDALLKPSVAAKQSKGLQLSPEPERVDRYRHLAQAADNLRTFSIFGENIVVQVFNEKSVLHEGSQYIASSSQATIRHSENKLHSDKNMPKKYETRPLDVDTAEIGDREFDKKVALLNAQQLLLKACCSSSSLVTVKEKCNTSRLYSTSQVKNIKCETRELLPGGSHDVIDDHRAMLSGKVPLIVQRLAKEVSSSTEIRCQNTHTNVTVQDKDMDTEASNKDIYRHVVCKPEQFIKLESAKICLKDRVKPSETAPESETAKSLKPGSLKISIRDRIKSEMEAEAIDSCLNGVTYRNTERNTVSPFGHEWLLQTDQGSYGRKSVSPSSHAKLRQTDQKIYRNSLSPSSCHAKLRQTDQKSYRNSVSPSTSQAKLQQTDQKIYRNSVSPFTSQAKLRQTEQKIYRNSVSPSSSHAKLRQTDQKSYRNSVSPSTSQAKLRQTEQKSYRNSVSPSANQAQLRQTNERSYCRNSTSAPRDTKRRHTDLWNNISPCSDAKRKRTDRKSCERSSPYSRKRRRSSSSSSSSYSRRRSLSSDSRNSRSSHLSRDSRSYYRSRHYRRDKRSSSSSRHRSRRSRSHSSSSYSRHRQRSSSRSSSRRYSRNQRSVSSSRDSSSESYRRRRSKSRGSRYSTSDSHSSSRHSNGSKKTENYLSHSKDDKRWTKKPKNQHPLDMFYTITNMGSQSNAQKQSQQQTGGTENGSSASTIKSESSSANLSTQNHAGSSTNKTLTNDRSASGCQEGSGPVSDDGKVGETNRTLGKERSATDTYRNAGEESRHRAYKDRASDYSEMLRSHRLAQSHPGNLRYLRTYNVTVKQLIISQLGISITPELTSILPYSLHTVLSDKCHSREERQRRCLETIQRCMKHLSIPSDIVPKSTIEPVINNFGNRLFEDRLEHFSDEQILLEANVIKKCQCILDQQQCRGKFLSSFIQLQLGSQLSDSMLFEPGTFSGEPLPADLQVPLRGFTFKVPEDVIHEDIAFSIKDSLEVSVESLLELIKLTDFGRAHFRVPEILLLQRERFQLYSEGGCFLILNKSLPKKVFIRLLTLKNRIESLAEDPNKSDEEKYACDRQLVGERVSVLLPNVGTITHKRVAKLRTLYHQLMKCENYMRKVIGSDGLRKLALFDNFMCAVKHHYDMLNEEFIDSDLSDASVVERR